MEVVTKMKTANVIARVEPDVKIKAEAILKQLGIPVSVLIDSLYRQVIYLRGVPFQLIVPSEENMTKEELEEMLDEGLRQADNGEGRPADEVFDSILNELKDASI